jgi:hypothetical protein
LNDYIGTTGVWYLQLVGAKDFKADVLPKNLMATVSISKTRSFTTKVVISSVGYASVWP